MKKKNKKNKKKTPDLWLMVDALGGESVATDERVDVSQWSPVWMADWSEQAPAIHAAYDAYEAAKRETVEAAGFMRNLTLTDDDGKPFPFANLKMRFTRASDATPAPIPPATPDPADSFAGCPLDGPCECCPADCDVCEPAESGDERDPAWLASDYHLNVDDVCAAFNVTPEDIGIKRVAHTVDKYGNTRRMTDAEVKAYDDGPDEPDEESSAEFIVRTCPKPSGIPPFPMEFGPVERNAEAPDADEFDPMPPDISTSEEIWGLQKRHEAIYGKATGTDRASFLAGYNAAVILHATETRTA